MQTASEGVPRMFMSTLLDWRCRWWHHDMETLSSLLAICEGNPSQGPVMLSFDVLFLWAVIKRLTNNLIADDLSGNNIHNWMQIAVMSSQWTNFTNTTMHHSEQKCAHFCSEWRTVGQGTGALCNWWDWSVSDLLFLSTITLTMYACL